MHLCQGPSALPQPWPTCGNPILFLGCKHWDKRKNGTSLKAVSLKQSGLSHKTLKRAQNICCMELSGKEGTEVSGSRDGRLSGEEETRPQARNPAAYKTRATQRAGLSQALEPAPLRPPPYAGLREGPPPALCCSFHSFPCNPNRHRNTALNRHIP